MQLSKILVFTVSLTVLALHVPGSAEAAKKEENDGRVCVRLGVETNHPLVKVCTRKAEVVEASNWYKDKESVHFVFRKSSDAYKAGHIKYTMDGEVNVTPQEIRFCIMEIPSFRGTDEQVKAHNNSVAAAHYYAAKSAGIDLTGVKSVRVVPRSKDGYYPSDCDIVAATGSAWKKSWTKVIAAVSMRSSPNSRFGPEFKQGFTNEIGDLGLAVSLSPADIEQGAVVAKLEMQKSKDERAATRDANDQLIAAGSDQGFAFLRLDAGSKMLCHTHPDSDAAIEAIKSHDAARSQFSEWGVTDAKSYKSVEDVFQAVMGSQCKALMASPAELGRLRDALANRSITTETGWALISGEAMVAAEAKAVEARRLAAIEAEEQAERERLAAEQSEKERAERAERQRLAAIERAKTHPFKAFVYCSFQGNYLNLLACFDDTQLKITMNNRSRIYEAWELNSAGRMTGEGLYIDLPRNFELQARNGSDLTLGVQILDQFQKVVFEDQAGKYGSVYVGND